ncbi:MAG: protein kinase [Betaproteobacteria bacterium]|nr:protein kinase [Betaproteobacteria bacterium]
MLDKIGKYEVRKEIGRGAMGTVYEGFDPAIGRRVAIKTLRTDVFDHSQLPEVLARFKREAQSAGRLSHPHIVTIYEYGEESGTPYIVMEFMAGTELGQLLSRGTRFPLEEIVRVMTQLLGALAVAHESGVVHRDLKPANLFMLQDGSLKVVDFGIAHVEASDLTGTGALLGTPAYMSPEQVLGLPVDLRSDIFSAGVIFYQLLTGDKPFTGSIHTINQKILQQEPLEPSKLNPLLSAAWDAVVSRAMAKKPAVRYESSRHFAEAIKAAFQAEHAHDEEAKRKAADASEHAYRAAEERSRVEAMRRAEAERVAKEEAEARKAAEDRARQEAQRREEEAAARAQRDVEEKARADLARRKADETAAMPQPRSRIPMYVALAIVAVLGVLGGGFYVGGDTIKRAVYGEQFSRLEDDKLRREFEENNAAALRRAEEIRTSLDFHPALLS